MGRGWEHINVHERPSLKRKSQFKEGRVPLPRRTKYLPIAPKRHRATRGRRTSHYRTIKPFHTAPPEGTTPKRHGEAENRATGQGKTDHKARGVR